MTEWNLSIEYIRTNCSSCPREPDFGLDVGVTELDIREGALIGVDIVDCSR